MYRQIVLYTKVANDIVIRILYNISTESVNVCVAYVNRKAVNLYRLNHKRKAKESRVKSYKHYQVIMRELKINGCAICGYNTCDRALSFHHVNLKDKKFCMSIKCVGRSNSNVVNELNKCILLCANCHMEIHERLNRP